MLKWLVTCALLAAASPADALSVNAPPPLIQQETLLAHVGRQSEPLLGVFAGLQAGCKAIASKVRRAGISDLTGLAEGVNTSGDQQKKLDVVSNELLSHYLHCTGDVGVLASEEEPAPVVSSQHGQYCVVFDPLDGSSNVDASIPTGTIFGIYECLRDHQGQLLLEESALQQGRSLVAAGYCLYSHATLMVISLGDGTHMFTLDGETGEFLLTHPRICMPQRGSSYSLNEARQGDWPSGLDSYITDLKTGKGQAGKEYDLVYVCSLVADVHYTLFRGGIAMNPRSHLRLVYEGNPMGFVVAHAGGSASDGAGPMLDREPTALHQRTPTFLGSREDVQELERYGRERGGVQQLGNKTYAQ